MKLFIQLLLFTILAVPSFGQQIDLSDFKYFKIHPEKLTDFKQCYDENALKEFSFEFINFAKGYFITGSRTNVSEEILSFTSEGPLQLDSKENYTGEDARRRKIHLSEQEHVVCTSRRRYGKYEHTCEEIPD